MAEGTEAQVDGAMVTVVDLSRHGAQILCPIPLKPQQRVRMILGDDLGLAKFSASVAWASFEIPSTPSACGTSHEAVPTPNHSAAVDFSRMIVSFRPDPVDMIDTGTPETSSRNAT